jgi:tRNA G18 (ribose-2'-O)-methylase SpoU
VDADEPDVVAGVGVGPWDGPWPEDPRLDPELLAHGDRRNVVDRYRYWRREAVVADLDLRRHDFHVAIENWQHDFNIGSVVRTANAFLAREVHVVGRRRWNRRGAMVTDRYQHVRHHEDVSAFAAWAAESDLLVVGIDNLPGCVPLESTRLPRACVLLFGQEGPGLSAPARAAAGTVCSIAQFGSTRSINAGAAAAVAMHTWIRQHVQGHPL